LANAGDEHAVALVLGHGGDPPPDLIREAIVGWKTPAKPAPPPSREDLLARAVEPGWKAVEAMRALRRIAGGDVGDDDEVREIYLSRAQDDSDLVREEAVSGLAASRSTANDVLRAALADPVLEIRILGALGLRDRGENSGSEVIEAARDHAEFGGRISR
jgi:hypothetical protein